MTGKRGLELSFGKWFINMVKPGGGELREHQVWIHSASLTSDQNARTWGWGDGLVSEGLCVAQAKCAPGTAVALPSQAAFPEALGRRRSSPASPAEMLTIAMRRSPSLSSFLQPQHPRNTPDHSLT